jgi:hypothetical protein
MRREKGGSSSSRGRQGARRRRGRPPVAVGKPDGDVVAIVAPGLDRRWRDPPQAPPGAPMGSSFIPFRVPCSGSSRPPLPAVVQRPAYAAALRSSRDGERWRDGIFYNEDGEHR